MKYYNYILIISLLFIATSCGISEDCFKGNGNRIIQNFPLEGFTKVKVYDGVGLIIKEGPDYEVRIETSDNIIDNLEVKLEGDMLVVKDNSTCNIARDYGQTIVYLTTPNLTEIHSKTNQDIKSEGVLRYPELKLYSIDISDGAGTGDFYLDVDNGYIFVESNNVSNFFIEGQVNYLDVFFTWGNGRFNGSKLIINNKFYAFHRGSNDLIIFPNPIILEGDIYSTGNIILKNRPYQVNINEHYYGKVVFQY
ncbi:GIN domain-containing protein [Flavobacterium sp. HNIBRBA15423]|uniref:GIN domain-containing protein n=1 Tax=Flavobacterium sp. HNIBRBA15423 TaxID=3458683 RepID=UPI004044A475